MHSRRLMGRYPGAKNDTIPHPYHINALITVLCITAGSSLTSENGMIRVAIG